MFLEHKGTMIRRSEAINLQMPNFGSADLIFPLPFLSFTLPIMCALALFKVNPEFYLWYLALILPV